MRTSSTYLQHPGYSTLDELRRLLLCVGCRCLQVKPPAFDQHRYLQRLNERCELMSLLTHLYVGADALKPHADSSSQHAREMTLSPDIYAAQMLLQQITSRVDQDEADQAEAEALTGPLKELSAMKWPSCSEQQFLSLLEKLGAAVYAASAGAAAATAPAGQLLLPYTGAAGRAATEAAGGSGSKGSRSQALELQQLSEALVSSAQLLLWTCLCASPCAAAACRLCRTAAAAHDSLSGARCTFLNSVLS